MINKKRFIMLVCLVFVFFCISGCENSKESINETEGQEIVIESNLLNVNYIENLSICFTDNEFIILTNVNEKESFETKYSTTAPDDDWSDFCETYNKYQLDETYFKEKYFIIMPYMHSSSVEDIKINNITIIDDENLIDVNLIIETPNAVDSDIVCTYCMIELDREYSQYIADYKFEIKEEKIILKD